MSLKPVREHSGWIAESIPGILFHLTCLGYVFVFSLALTLVPALIFALADSNGISLLWLWVGFTSLLTFCVFSAISFCGIKDSLQKARRWKKAGGLEIEVHVHWLGDDETGVVANAEDYNAYSDADSLENHFRLDDLGGKTFPTLQETIQAPDWTTSSNWSDIAKNVSQGFDEVLVIRFPKEKPPVDCLQAGTKFELLSGRQTVVDGYGEILSVRLG